MVDLYLDDDNYVYAVVDGKSYKITLIRVADIYDISNTIIYNIMDFINDNKKRRSIADDIMRKMDINDMLSLINVVKEKGEPVMFNTSIGKYVPIIVDECDIYNLNLRHVTIDNLIFGGRYE